MTRLLLRLLSELSKLSKRYFHTLASRSAGATVKTVTPLRG